MIEVRVVYGGIGGVAPKAFLGFQMRYDAVTLAAVSATRGGCEEAGLASNKQVTCCRVTRAEFTRAVVEAGVGAEAVALPAVHGGAAGDKRRQDKQSAQSHGAVRALRAPLTALYAAAERHTLAPPRRPTAPRPPLTPLPYIRRDGLVCHFLSRSFSYAL